MRIHVAPWVVPIASPPLRDGAVAVDERGVVHAIGRASELARPSTSLRPTGGVREHRGVILPGLVNAHAHVELSHMARVPGGDGLVPWIRRLLATRANDAERESRVAEAAATYLLSRGTVAVADVSNEGHAAGPLRAAGIELVDLHEFVAPRSVGRPVRPGSIPTAHATYTVGAGAMRELADQSDGRIRSIHVEEDPAEAMYLVEGSGPMAELLDARDVRPEGTPSGKRPIEHLDALGVLGPGTLLVHLTFAPPASLALARVRGAIGVLCPRSNLHITGKLPPFAAIHASGLPVALGSDSLASSPSLDVLAEAQTLARAGADPAWLLAALTDGGARALALPHLGAIAPGRKPGLIAIGDARNLEDPVAWLAHDAADAPVERIA
jgi:cytosine/adenosine deaminase-related metal-dependent hydrolase